MSAKVLDCTKRARLSCHRKRYISWDVSGPGRYQEKKYDQWDRDFSNVLVKGLFKFHIIDWRYVVMNKAAVSWTRFSVQYL